MKKRGEKTARIRSAALLITLIFIALITLVVLGFLSSMSVDLVSSNNHLAEVEAGFYAQEGADMAQTRLYSVFSDTKRQWVSQPGMLVASPAGAAYPLNTTVPLSSGVASSGSTADQAVDLNPAALANASNNIVGSANIPMVVQWIYQYQDGTFSTNTGSATTYDKANPIVGRLAFWTDDESTKLNINTALDRRGNTNGLSDPSQVSLGVLNSSDVSAVSAYRTNQAFNTVEELGRATNVSSALLGQGFSLTTYDHSPNTRLNMFGEQRILLTTQQSLATAFGYTNFLDVLATPNTDPGVIANLSASKYNAAVTKVMAELTRSDWPLLPGKSFINKYPDVAQLAMNIVEYVRSAESTNLIVEPTRADDTGGATFSYDSGAGASFGVTRRPTLTEQAVFFPPSANAHPYITNNAAGQPTWYYYPSFAIELYYPHIYGGWTGTIPLNTLCLYVNMVSTQYSAAVLQNTPAFSTADYGSQATIQPGQYVKIVCSESSLMDGPYPSGTSYAQLLNQSVGLRLIPYVNKSNIPRLGGAQSVTYGYPLTQGGIEVNALPSSRIQSLSVDDPFVNLLTNNWALVAQSFGTTNINTTVATTSYNPAASAQQDTDANGLLTEGLMLPAPKGSAQNPLGVVQSLGELGFIHTGVTALANDSVPWRTIRLQPEKAGSTDLPDWLLLDLFAVPVTNAVFTPERRPLFQPLVTSSAGVTNVLAFGGQININGSLVPFTNYPSRVLPLESLVSGLSNSVYDLPQSSVPTVATNLLNDALATGSLHVGRSFSPVGGPTNVYYSPGQIAEVAGIADSGEASEEAVRRLTGLISVRGDVFSVYSVGQSLKQDSSGALHVLGESRLETTVERAFAPDGTVQLEPINSLWLQP